MVFIFYFVISNLSVLSLCVQVKYDFLYDLHHVCCQERWSSSAHRKQYATFILVFLFLLPLAAMLILYTRIGIELWIRKQVGDSSVLNAMNQREVSKISRYFFLLFSAYAIYVWLWSKWLFLVLKCFFFLIYNGLNILVLLMIRHSFCNPLS